MAALMMVGYDGTRMLLPRLQRAGSGCTLQQNPHCTWQFDADHAGMAMRQSGFECCKWPPIHLGVGTFDKNVVCESGLL